MYKIWPTATDQKLSGSPSWAVIELFWRAQGAEGGLANSFTWLSTEVL
jgi:hypothetical protein